MHGADEARSPQEEPTRSRLASAAGDQLLDCLALKGPHDDTGYILRVVKASEDAVGSRAADVKLVRNLLRTRPSRRWVISGALLGDAIRPVKSRPRHTFDVEGHVVALRPSVQDRGPLIRLVRDFLPPRHDERDYPLSFHTAEWIVAEGRDVAQKRAPQCLGITI